MSRNVARHLDNLDPEINFNLNNDACNYYTINNFNMSFSSDSDKYFLLNQNIQSFNSKQTVFEAFLESFNIQFHAIVLSETWNDSTNIKLCAIENFEPIHTHRIRPPGHHGGIGGGISIFANSSMYNIKKK